ncbi:hypothetical protein VKT23_001244 [Stygiomarasmius scandens]|uniref:NAD-dependent epimerase/dehydratase domain-containing protein n=1 Tax=Marasmiellus scandens TaxID=2682957 RepID=A0ABR1K6I5_9AGAR
MIKPDPTNLTLIYTLEDARNSVTGASGFVGSHVVKALLERRYNVVAAARGSKADHIRKSCDKYPGRLRVAEITDLAKDDMSKDLEGVSGLVHVATPMIGRTPLDEMIPATIECTMNVIRQAERAGAKSIVITGSGAQVTNTMDGTISNDGFNPITKEEALASGEPLMIYAAAKKYAELTVWEWAEAHPHVEVTILFPPWIFGPYAPEFYPLSPQNHSSNQYLYGLINPEGRIAGNAPYVDVRDLAKAHVNALESPPTSKVGRKRVVIASPQQIDGKKALEILAEKRPQLKPRLIKRQLSESSPEKYGCDFGRIEEVFGLKETDFLPYEQVLRFGSLQSHLLVLKLLLLDCTGYDR